MALIWLTLKSTDTDLPPVTKIMVTQNNCPALDQIKTNDHYVNAYKNFQCSGTNFIFMFVVT